MNINPITQYKNTFKSPTILKQKSNISFKNMQKTPLTQEDYQKAQEYCKQRCKELNLLKTEMPDDFDTISITDFNLDKLNGIQYGIELFAPHGKYDGMTAKEIVFAIRELSILLNRGCYNQCSHCYMNAIPPAKLTGATSFTYEDFKKILDGVSELISRIEACGVDLSFTSIDALFSDSDCIDIEIKDENGKKYDIVDCFSLLQKYPNIKTSGLIDTSGWTPSSTVHQKRAEKLVEFIQDMYGDENFKNKSVRTIIVSVNPFHCLYQKYIDLKDKDPQKAQKYRDLYIKRMANVLYTFSPLLIHEDLLLYLNVTTLNHNPNYDYKAVDKLIDEILSELDKMYDKKGTPSYFKEYCLNKYNNIIRGDNRVNEYTYRQIAIEGRAKNLAGKYKDTKKYMQERSEVLTAKGIFAYTEKALEANGQVKVTENSISYPTDIYFNLSQSNKICPPLGEEYEGELLHPHNMIEY